MKDKQLIMIGKAAQIAGVHIQTLRIYEERGLITPQRSAKGTRLYSLADVQRLARIQQLAGEGVNLLGAVRIIQLEEQQQQLEERLREAERERILLQHRLERQRGFRF